MQNDHKISRKELYHSLKKYSQTLKGLERLKTVYRPFICPLHKLLEFFQNNRKIYDVGCGNGSFLRLCHDYCAPKLLAGHDVSDRTRQSAHFFNSREVANIRYQAKEEPLPDLSGYDYVVLIDVLHHIPRERQRLFLEEIISKMEVGASLFILDINANYKIRSFINRAHDLVLSREYVHPLKQENVAAYFNETHVAIKDAGCFNSLWYSHYLLIISKVR